MSTDAKRAGNARHQSKLDRIVLQPYSDDGQRIREAAKTAGKSVQGYVLGAVLDQMERDRQRDGGGD